MSFAERVLMIALLLPMTAQAADAPPTVDTLKDVLERRLQRLKTDGFTERNVIFQDVRPGSASGGTYPFQVTALVRDYGPGYPPNRFYGQTCVGRMDKWRFALRKDEFGEWQVDGRMSMTDSTECKDNPAEGVSSIPLASLPGAPAGARAAAAPIVQPAPAAAARAEAPAAPGGVATGSYECWYFTRAQPGLNFTIKGPAQYSDVDGVAGTYALQGGELTFRGGALDGQTAVYHAPGGRPTVSFRRRGAEIAFCERAG